MKAKGKLFVKSYQAETETHSYDVEVFETPHGYSVEIVITDNHGRATFQFRKFSTWEKATEYLESLGKS